MKLELTTPHNNPFNPTRFVASRRVHKAASTAPSGARVMRNVRLMKDKRGVSPPCLDGHEK